MDRRHAMLLLLVVIAVVALFWPALDGQVLDWDDGVWLQDPLLEQPFGQAVITAFSTARDHAWYPLLRLSWWLQNAVTGSSTVAMHAVNLGLFAASVPLLATAMTRAGLAPRVALVATLLWAVHPGRVESVAWLTSRKDVLSLVAVLITAHLVLSQRNALATLNFLVACLCKAAVFPLAAVFWLLARALGRPTDPLIPMLGVGGGIAVFGAVAYADPGRKGYPFDSLLDNGLFLIGLQGDWSLRLFEITGLAAVQAVPTALIPWGIAGALCFVGLALLVGSTGRWGQVLGALWLFPLLPVHGLVPMGFWGADRHLLIPSIAAAIAIAWAADRWLHWTAPLLLALPLAWGTATRIPDWHDSTALWAADHERSGDHWVRGLMYGTALGRDGRFAEAVEVYRHAETLEPGNSDLLARRLLAEMAADGWTSLDAKVARGLQPPPITAAQWRHTAELLIDIEHPSACDAARQAERLGATLPSACR